MKLGAELSASTTSFFREIKRKLTPRVSKKHVFKRIFAITIIAAVFGGFFCLIFLNSLNSLEKAKKLNLPKISNFSESIDLIFAKKAQAKTTSDPISCEKGIPLTSMVNPAATLFKVEKLCFSLKLEKTASADQTAQAQKNTPSPEEIEKEALNEQLKKILEGTPMEEMVEHIANQPRIVAAYLVGIALKESSLGEHSPKKNGAHCYNYWGYKGSINPTGGGYACFSSAQEAVEIVGKKLEKLAIEQKKDSPSKMVTTWKCGTSCQTHSPQSVSKWVSDVSKYYYQINPKKEIAKN